ncbi:Hpt domain-containing protein [Sulfurovum sp. ST-21]|uniref:Hpt domain-containing protein n=1 Tax=Sulfurovum indicum TaxID=2779528 RepID=A0A7M1S5Z5_9BACT|nr:Hpt domain-containing protein [Sulfurovum indicum]QOR62381.1 Hpt domain-containing protein [Sulfurovum indicum]
MYYIINQANQILAIDPQLLSQIKIESADEFYKKVALGEVIFDTEENEVSITVDGDKKSFTAKISPLASILGDIKLVYLKAGREQKISTNNDTFSNFAVPDESPVKEEKEEEISFDDTTLLEVTKEGTEKEEADISTEEETFSLDDTTLFELKEEPEEEKPEAEVFTEEKEENELFELLLPSDAENAIAQIDSTVEESTEKENTAAEIPADQNAPIYIDIERISEKIGISPDDYNLFLNEYIDTALTLEKALQSQNEKEKEEALNTLSHLSNVLHLPFVGDIIEQIKQASLTEVNTKIESFFATLGRLTTSHFKEEKASSDDTEERAAEGEREPIDLSDVKPIYFDFQLEEAAKDLSLPVELIEEFVNDFIVQAREETKKMLAAYEKGDLETIQKIGHLLKGTSSNLRINPLSETLYEIQFNEDIERVPELIKNYWAHFLSLENQIKIISNK